jgi:hypothetical protein
MSLALETVAPWNVSIVDLACPAQVEMSVALLPRFEKWAHSASAADIIGAAG